MNSNKASCSPVPQATGIVSQRAGCTFAAASHLSLVRICKDLKVTQEATTWAAMFSAMSSSSTSSTVICCRIARLRCQGAGLPPLCAEESGLCRLLATSAGEWQAGGACCPVAMHAGMPVHQAVAWQRPECFDSRRAQKAADLLRSCMHPTGGVVQPRPQSQVHQQSSNDGVCPTQWLSSSPCEASQAVPTCR